MNKITGSGVLPILKIKGQLCIVIGREVSKSDKFGYDIWEDFGGGIDPNELPIQCAKRELLEETAMTIDIGESELIHYIDSQSQVDLNYYRIYFVRINKNFSIDFKTNLELLKNLKYDEHFLEMDDITFIPIKHLLDMDKYNLKKKLTVVKNIHNQKVVLSSRMIHIFFHPHRLSTEHGITYVDKHKNVFNMVELDIREIKI
tara:strand:- start:40 stop:645 length:606 start_codon:yes stop_codon:yes gene_type:complete